MAYPAITEWAGRLFRKQLTAALDAIDGGGALTKVDKAGDTMTGTLVTAAPSIAAGLRLQPAGADPSSPVDGDVWRRTSDMRARIGATSYTFAFLNGTSTFTGKKTFAASAPGGATLNVAHGTAPSSPVDGDVWTTTTGVFAQVNGATVQLDAAGGGGNPALSWVV